MPDNGVSYLGLNPTETTMQELGLINQVRVAIQHFPLPDASYVANTLNEALGDSPYHADIGTRTSLTYLAHANAFNRRTGGPNVFYNSDNQKFEVKQK